MPTWLLIALLVVGLPYLGLLCLGVAIYIFDRHKRRRSARRIPITRPRLSMSDRRHPLHVLGARRGPGPDIDHPAGKPRLP